MTAPAECRYCGTAYMSTVTYSTFTADYAERLGTPFTGRRPGWIDKFCSERCRYADVAARSKIQTDRMSRRRAEQRRAARDEHR